MDDRRLEVRCHVTTTTMLDDNLDEFHASNDVLALIYASDLLAQVGYSHCAVNCRMNIFELVAVYMEASHRGTRASLLYRTNLSTPNFVQPGQTD